MSRIEKTCRLSKWMRDPKEAMAGCSNRVKLCYVVTRDEVVQTVQAVEVRNQPNTVEEAATSVKGEMQCNSSHAFGIAKL